jgi:ribosomal protein S27AE
MKWTPEQEAFLRDNFEKHTNKELTEMLGVAASSIGNKAHKLRLIRSKASINAHRYGEHSSNWKGGITVNNLTEYRKLQMRRLRHGEKAENYKKRRVVNDKVRWALKKGVLQKGVCVVCGATEVVGHHEDYDKPLDVIWVCVKCHAELDKRKRARDKAKAKAAI